MPFVQLLQVGHSGLSHFIINSDTRNISENLWNYFNGKSAHRKGCFDKGRNKHQRLNYIQALSPLVCN
jgi:hypothetical protein